MRTVPTHELHSAAGPAQIRVLHGRAETAWDAAILGTLTPGDRVIILHTGPLSTLWARIAIRLGLVVESVDEGMLGRHLGADRFGTIRAVFAAHPGAGACLDLAAVRGALDSAFHDALLFVDASAAPETKLGACCVDIAVTDPGAGLAGLVARSTVKPLTSPHPVAPRRHAAE